MNYLTHITAFLIVLIAPLLDPVIGAADDPDHVTILYTSDELGYLEPCG